MDDLQRAIKWLEQTKSTNEGLAREHPWDKAEHTQTAANCRALLDALRENEEDQRRGNQKIKELAMAYSKLQEELRWVPVTEREPTKKDCFEIGRSKELCIVVLRDGFTDYPDPDIHYVRGFESLAEYFEDAGITHWRPLPEPPEGSK